LFWQYIFFVRDDTQNCFGYNRICSNTFFQDDIQTCSGYNNIFVLAIVISCSIYNNNMCLSLFWFVLTPYLLFGMTYKLVLTVVLVCSGTPFVFVLAITEYITVIKKYK
jgi:hypothetical protein